MGDDGRDRDPGFGRGAQKPCLRRSVTELRATLPNLEHERSAGRELKRERLSRRAAAQAMHPTDGSLAEHLSDAMRDSLQPLIHGADSFSFARCPSPDA